VRDCASVLGFLSECAQHTHDRDMLARTAVEALVKELPQAGWIGVYWLDRDRNALKLGPYHGPKTEHVLIPVGTGVCGTAVTEDRDQVVDDVRKRENYLACTPTVRSEIVVLIRQNGHVVGQIDCDSDQVAAFTPSDHAFLKMVAGALGSLIPPYAPYRYPSAAR
jgi:L-methionine (R)-S-oxide reductase